jgi:DNA-binding GntR family transcriptional regulator
MKVLAAADAKLVDLVKDSILAEIAGGTLPSGARIVPQDLEQRLGVSRQSVQQALQVLRNLGVLQEAPGRGLLVAPLDLEHVRNMYDMRAVIEGLAFRKAAERNAERARVEGPEFIRAGRRAVDRGEVADMVEADMAFHDFIYALSENPLVAPTIESHWTNTQRVMGEVLLRDEAPRDVWDQHEALLKAIIEGNGEKAEQLARHHIDQSASFMIERLRREADDE